MKISYNWLQNYLPTLHKVDIKELSHKLSSSLAEVEKIENRGEGLEKIVVGEIKEISKHPKTKKLLLAMVDTGDNVRKILFNAGDELFVKIGNLYPVCLPGGKVFDKKSNQDKLIDIEIKEFEGIESEGVLCSQKELGINDEERGVNFISPDLKIGQDLLPILQDKILEIENKSLTHRPDCFSHRGIAREISAIMRIEFLDKPEIFGLSKTLDNPFKVEVKENVLCKRFTAISLGNIEVKMSPTWMQVSLSYVGVRPINNIVDISNYIMLDMGYPTHIYDYDKITDKSLIVRRALNNEKAETLNQKKYTLTEEMVVVSDTKNVEDIAGIMGGAGSEISSNTKNVIIESANWDMFNIRKTSMTLGVTSEAGVRFAKGLDSSGTEETVNRVATLIEDLANGEVSSELIDHNFDDSDEKVICFDLNSVKRLIGIEISKEEIINILKSLFIEVRGNNDTPLNISDQSVNQIIELVIPRFRKDLNITQDIIEEIARIYGYEKIEPRVPERTIKPIKDNSDTVLTNKIRNYLCEAGLDEVYSYSFTGKSSFDLSGLNLKKAVKLKNPLSPELEYFRTSIIPSLVEKIELNMNNFNSVNIFELSRIINKATLTDEKLPDQSRKISGLFCYKNEVDDVTVFQKSKEVLDYLFEKLRIDVSFSNLDNNIKLDIEKIFHPTKSAKILSKDNTLLGHIGLLHPLYKMNAGLKKYTISAFELDYEQIKSENEKIGVEYTQLPSTQEVLRDISFILNGRIEVARIIKFISSKEIKNLAQLSLIDRFSKNDIESITLRCKIQDPVNTLKDEEIKSIVDEVVTAVESEFDVKIK